MKNEAVEDDFIDNPDDLWAVDDVKIITVLVAEWNKKVRLKMMSAAERDAFEASTIDTKGGKNRPNIANLRARLVSRCLVNAEGDTIFKSGDVERLGRKSARAIDFLFQKCQELNGFTEADIEELAGDFGGTTGSDSSTD